MQTLLLWPNIDAGADHISKAIRRFRTSCGHAWLRTLTNLSPDIYMKVLAGAASAIGNSSSFVRDASFLGTPVVLVGNRQAGRETAEHVIRVAPVAAQIAEAARVQLKHGRFAPSSLYGDGYVSGPFADRLADISPYVQKQLVFEDLKAHAPED